MAITRYIRIIALFMIFLMLSTAFAYAQSTKNSVQYTQANDDVVYSVDNELAQAYGEYLEAIYNAKTSDEKQKALTSDCKCLKFFW